MIVNYGPASRIADDEILVRLKEVEDQGLTITEKLSGIEIDIGNVETKVSEAVETAAGTDKKVTTLTQNVDNITAKVEKIEGSTTDYTEIKATLDGLTITTENGKTIIDGGNIDASSLNLTDKITFSQIGGAVSKDQLDEATQKELKDHGDALTGVLESQGAFNETLLEHERVMTNNDNLLASWIGGKANTEINGTSIVTPTIYSSAIHLGGDLTVYTVDGGATKGGHMGYAVSTLKPTEDNKPNVGMHMISANNVGEIHVTDKGSYMRAGSTDNEIGASTGQVSLKSSGVPYYFYSDHVRTDVANNNKIKLGTTAAQWAEVHAGTGYYKDGSAYTSDANLKNNIEPLPEKYITMFDNFTPVRYKLNDGTSGRYHVGFISQEVEEAMNSADVDSQEFGGFVIYKDEDGNEKYMLRYQEFIGVLAAKVKQLEARIEELEAK